MRTENDLYGWQCRLVTRVIAAIKRKKDKGVFATVDMGQGKTAPGLTIVSDAMDMLLVNATLVIAPIKICEAVWRQEAKKWTHTRDITFSLVRGSFADRAFAIARRADVYLVNPELLQWLYEHLRGNFSRFDLIFVDESSLFKSPRSKRFKTLKKIKKKHASTITFVPMTGTPRPNSLMDVWTQAYLVDEGERLGENFSDFRFNFFHKTKTLAEHTFAWEEDEGAFDAIKEKLADITIELSDEEKQHFPIVEVPHWVNLPPRVRKVYQQLEDKMVYEWDNSVIIPKHGGAKSILLRQMAAGAVYVNRLLGLEYQEVHKEKLNYLKELLEELNRQVIITLEFKHDLIRLQNLLPKTSRSFKTGNTAETIKDWQRGNIGQLLMHPASAGFGLDGLQDGGATVIFFNETWSQQNYSQLIARLARTGQMADQVFAHGIRTRNTVEQLMQLARTVKGNEQHRFRTALRLYQAEKGLL